MKVHLAAVSDSELAILLPARARHSHHVLVEDPAAADLILFYGSFRNDPDRLLRHPLYLASPERCAVYTEEDTALPLVPGVYSSGATGLDTRVGRVFTYGYVSSHGLYSNPYVSVADVPKTLLFSFQGGSTSFLRKHMFNLRFDRADVLIENTSNYYHWDLSQQGREARQERYARTIASSHFVLCPRGAGTSSIRFFETMEAGIAPVLIADRYELPPNVPWESFLIRIGEKDIGRLPELLEPYRASSAERGRLAREAWLQHFAPEREFDAIVQLAAASLRHGGPSEATFRARQRRMLFVSNARRAAINLVRNGVLKTMRLLRLRSPYQLNER